MKKRTLILFIMGSLNIINARANDLPVKEWQAAKHDKPLLFYITGDGGLNDFSTGLCTSLNQSGYDVVALNSRSYFWDKKTPEETAAAIADYLNVQLKERKSQEVVLIGYSFGADVMPFIVNRMADSVKNKVKHTIIMAPSTSTDFEIHWSDIMGGSKKRDMDVLAEINKLNEQPLAIITGSDDDAFPFKSITLKKYTHEVLPGGHHFDKDTDEVAKTILKYSK